MDAVEKIKPILEYEIFPLSLYGILDFDSTLTAIDSSTLYEEFYFHELPAVNPNIEKNLNILMKCIRDIDNSPFDFSKSHARLDRFLRKCELTKEQVVEACVRVGESKNIKIVPHAFETILELEKMNCKIGINTGSPKTAVEEVSRRKIGIQPTNIAATEFFYKNGFFIGSRLNLGKNKEISMSEYFLPKAYCDFSLTVNPNWPKIIYIADGVLSPFEKYIAAKVGSSLGIVLEVKKDQKEIKGYEYVINATEIRKDLRKIKPYIELYRRATIYPFLVKPEESYQAIKLADEIKLSQFDNFEDLLDKIQDFLSIEVLFPTLTKRVDKKCRELKKKLKNGLKRSEVEEIVNILKAYDPAFNIKEERKEELKKIILSSTSP